MDDVDAPHEPNSGESRNAGRLEAALEHVVDPVISVVDDTITFANEAARRTLELPTSVVGESAAVALGDRWDRLSSEIAETTVGTARHVDLDLERYDARIHRGSNGATIICQRLEDRESAKPLDTDRAVKTRAINEAPVGVSISDPSREDNPLVYVNTAYRELTGYSADDVVGRNCRLLQGPDSDPDAVAKMREAIDEERPVTVEVKNYRKDGTPFWNEVTIAPVRNDDGEVTNYVGFQNDITARKEAQFALQERTDELEYILDRVEGLIQDVTSAVAGSTSRSDLEAAVCERIATEEAYQGAWIGERNPSTETLEIRTSAGVEPEDLPVDEDHPAAECLRSGTATAASVGGTTHAAFPLEYNGVEYGTLTVCTVEERPVGDREMVILSALARAVASGINARETSRMLATDAVVAVELEFTDRALDPVAIAAETDARLEYRRSVHRTGDETASLFTVSNASAAELADASATLDIDLEVLVEREDGCLVELASEGDLVAWLAERGIQVRSIDAENGRARVVLEIPHSTNVRSVVETVKSRYENTEVLSFRQHERHGETREEFAARLEEDLTDRQFASLQRAYLGGYFDWPRPTTGEELAQSMGVSRPTFHEHLRAAEAKLCRAFFDDDASETARQD